MRNLLILSLLFLGSLALKAQDVPESFSLQEAITYALEHNYTAINADRDVLDAQKQKWEVIARGLPQISGSVNYQNQLKQPVSLVPAEFFGGEPGTFQPIVFGQPQQASAFATLRQQIFDGSYIVGVQATKTFLDYTANTKAKTDLEVRKAVTEAYGNVLLAQESVAILNRNKEALEKNLYETEKLYQNGLGDEESVEQLQITLAGVENQLKNSQRLEKITLQMLNLMMGVAIENPTHLSEDLDGLTKEKMDPLFVEQDFQLENNVDYRLVQNLNEQRNLELKLAKSKALPTLNAFINYGSTAFSDQFNFFNGDTQWFDSSILGFDLSIPIFSSLGRSASTQRAKIALDKAKTQLKETEQQLNLQVDNARSNFILAVETYHTSKQNLDLAERIEIKNQTKYREGLASSFELRQAQLQLYSAQQEYLNAMVQIISTKTELETLFNN